MLLRETGLALERMEFLQRLHSLAYKRLSRDVRPLPGAKAVWLERAGACCVFADPAEMLDHLDEVGGRR